MQQTVIAHRKKRLYNMAWIDRALRPAGIVAAPKLRPKQARGIKGHKRARVNDPIRPETIVRAYEGDTAVLFATGPSLTSEVVDAVMNARVRSQTPLRLFGCNDAYQIVSTLDVHYACDATWWNRHYQHMKDYVATHGLWTQEPHMSKSDHPNLRRIAGRSGKGLSVAQDLIHFGNNSGYQLINVALLFGIKRMILCGYNMSVVDKKRHFFGDHPQGLNRSGNYRGFIGNYKTIKPADYGIEIINATPQSALDMFPKMSLEEALKL